MRSFIVACVLALAVVSAVSADPISSANTNSVTPTNTIVATCAAAGNRITGTAQATISTANNNNCVTPLYYITNACDPASALAPFPSNGFFPGTSTPIPQNQYVCSAPTTTQAAKHTCTSSVLGTCPTYPNGNTAVSTDRWAVPRPLLGSAAYPVISRGTFTVFPLAGADGTYVYPTDIPSLQPYSTQATSFGTAQFDFKCRAAGPANSRAIICADGTNQNYFSAPLNYGFSPASRSATTFMTYGRGSVLGLLGAAGTLTNGLMNNHNYQIYARYTNYAAANNVPLPAAPQKVLQPTKPVYAFDPYALPTPTFVKIAASVDSFIVKGIERQRLINENLAYLGVGATSAQQTLTTTRTFRGFYKGEQIGRSKTTGNYYGGVYYSPDEPLPDTTTGNSEIEDGYAKQPTWSGCFGTGPYLAAQSAAASQDLFQQFPTSQLTSSVNGVTVTFTDPRYASGSAASTLPGMPGTSFPVGFTCNDWTFYLDTTSSGSRVVGVVGDPGINFYINGNPGSAASDQPYVTTWLSDNLPPQACNTPNQSVYCSWFPTNVDGVKNGDETGIDCGGTTLGADNQGLPTPNCGCTAGYFYDYFNALCIPCIQDTYCNNPTGCVNECYPCFTAPTSGAALSGGQIGAAAVWPNFYANPQTNNLNSNDQTPGVGPIEPQAASPRATPMGEQFNTNGENTLLVGTTYNQANQKYDFAPTQCYCNIGFTASTNTATNPGTPLTVNDPAARYINAPGWLASGNIAAGTYSAGFKSANSANGPFDGSNCVPVVRGDPQITGLQGQDFQVHGIPDEFFNMVSHPDMQVNAHFVFLEDAKCDNYTTCFSHAGTYIDQIGMQIGGQKIKVLSGSMEEGIRVFIDDAEIKVGDKKQLKSARVFFANQRKVHIRTPLFSFAFINSDKFMNQEVALLDGKLAKLGAPLVTLKAGQPRPHQEIPLHGIVGQTWQNIQYPENMFIEGAVADYRIEESDLFGNTFAYNKFQL